MTTRRELLKLGAVGAFGLAGMKGGDGYANDFTAPGNVKNYRYPNWQAARTLWYHDHKHHITAQNVYSGLAGFYPLTDKYEQAQLPQGEFDVPLMISDAMFNADGSLGYNDNDHKGLWGDIIMVNGVPWPTMKVKPGSTVSASWWPPEMEPAPEPESATTSKRMIFPVLAKLMLFLLLRLRSSIICPVRYRRKSISTS